MPDDDRHTRDRVRTLDPFSGDLRKRARQGRESGISPDQLTIPEDVVRPKLEKALVQVLDKIGKPDLDKAAERAEDLARTLKDDGPESLDLCAGYRTSGMRALLDQAVSTVLASEDPEHLLALGRDELAARVGEEFALGAIRRYALDRVAPFAEEESLDVGDVLDFLELADLTFTTSILRALGKALLR